MTGEEIEACRVELTKIVERINGVRPNDEKLLGELRRLALKAGACPVEVVMTSGGPMSHEATASELVYNIHQALQTASIIDACRTAAKNHEIALAAMKETAESQRISKHTMIAAWVAAIAAWAAVILPPIARLVWAKVH
jgi:hypothetical protein